MVLQPVIDAWRHTFPKDLRFCRQCIILHAELHSIGRRYRDKKFIPRGEIQGVVDNWADVPYPWMRLRIIRQLALVPIINTVRIRRGEPAWLYTKAVKIEHAKVDAWLSKEANRKLYIPKDQFQREVLDVLHVPATYHYVFIFLASMCFFMFIFLVAAYSAEPLLYLYFRLWRRMSRKEIIDWYEAVALLHCATELPDAYRDSMVPTAFVKPNDDMVYFNVVEMTSPDRDCRIVFIPFPRIAPRTFFKQVGNICRNSQALILEECSLEALQTLPPAYFFPLKDDPFPCLDIHHRYWDVLESGDRPPPRLLPGNMPLEWFDKYFQGAIPFPLKVIYFPNSWTGTRADARTGWGRIKEAVQDTSLLSIACPWTPFQITNLKCSLLKEDWKVTRVETLPWMRPRQLGENFCDYYGIKDDELTPAPVASRPEPVVAPVETEKKKRATSGWLGRGQPSSVVNPTVVKAA